MPVVFVYVGNVYVVTDMDIERHAAIAEEVVRRCNASYVRLNISKCFFQTSIIALGHFVSAAGTALDPRKVQAVQDWVQPRNAEKFARLLGFVNFLRPNIRYYADLAASFTDLKKAKKGSVFH
jgi:hypothetical protein